MAVLTGKTREKFLQALREGCTRRQACRKAGIGPASLYREIHEDPTLREEIEDSEEEAIDEVVNVLWETATSGNTSAMFFYLMNKRPNEWQDRRNSFTPPKDDSADRQAAIKEAYDQLSDAAKEALEEADRRRLEDEYRREVRGDGVQRSLAGGAAPDAHRPDD